MITLRPVTSSTIKAIGYDAPNLYVLFNSQEIWRYSDVPAALSREFLAAPSKGAFLNSRVKVAFSGQIFTGQYSVQDFAVRLSLRELLPGPSFGF